MVKTILITGATDGIGLEAAKMLVKQGHYVLLHGRDPKKLQEVSKDLLKLAPLENYIADLSDFDAVKTLARSIRERHNSLDVLVNNAGVLKSEYAFTKDGYDLRFMVNTIAPYLLTKELQSSLGTHGRVINVSSAAQETLDPQVLARKNYEMDPMHSYAQSKLALNMWSYAMARELKENGPMILSLNPGSFLGTKMVKEGFGIEGKDLCIGAEALVRTALSEEFLGKSGKYFDNDSACFSNPHEDALNLEKCQQVVKTLETIVR